MGGYVAEKRQALLSMVVCWLFYAVQRGFGAFFQGSGIESVSDSESAGYFPDNDFCDGSAYGSDRGLVRKEVEFELEWFFDGSWVLALFGGEGVLDVCFD